MGTKVSEFQDLLSQIDHVIDHIDAFELQSAAMLTKVHPDLQESARNLVHYIALRQLDVRKLQFQLLENGFSSLGRAEGFTRGNLSHVRARLRESLNSYGHLESVVKDEPTRLTWPRSEMLLHRHTHSLLGAKPKERHVYIMVTAPSADKADETWMKNILREGANCLRINCAHEGPDEWLRIIDTLRKCQVETGSSCKVMMDIAGPKVRTSGLAPKQMVLHMQCEKNELGVSEKPARCAFVPISRFEEFRSREPFLIGVSNEVFEKLRVADGISLRDARDKKRRGKICKSNEVPVIIEFKKNGYITLETEIEIEIAGATIETFHPLVLPSDAPFLLLKVADKIRIASQHLTMDDAIPTVVCTLPEVVSNLKVGERVLFDDGKLETVVEQIEPLSAILKVQLARKGAMKLRNEKGINFPDTKFPIRGLTSKDLQDLDFILKHADMAALSFIRSEVDVREFLDQIRGRAPSNFGLVLKIETEASVRRFPSILLEAMSHAPIGVMIARGDLAVECGFDRLAEVQEELLWFCEAAHLPVIWATQVLDLMAQTGIPTRAEVTDAAMAVRAECVMLNKGPYIAQTIGRLDGILKRMEQHQYKKKSLLRPLNMSSIDW